MDAVPSGSVIGYGSYAQESDCCLRRLLCAVIKTIMFLVFAVFILCIPLGDPQQQCTREVWDQQQPKAVAYNYMCNIYRVMHSFVSVTTSSVNKASEFAGCVLINALYDAKLKFYSILETVDRQDLCRSVCCLDSIDDGDDPSLASGIREKKPCKCKAKCCRRVQSQTQTK